MSKLSRLRSDRNGCIMASCLWAAAALGLAYYDMHASLAAIGLSAFLARMAVTSQRRVDSIFARALAADLAEGIDLIVGVRGAP